MTTGPNIDKKVKVCHLASKHKMNDMRIFEKECKSLAKAGFDVTLIGFGDTAKTEVIDGVRCISLFCPIKNNLELLKKRNKMSLETALEVDADIYHLHEPELLPVGMKLKRKGKIVIFDSHEYYGWQLRDNIHKVKVIKVPAFLMKVFGNLYMHYEKHVCMKIDGVVQVCTMNGVDYFDHRCQKTLFIRNLPSLSDYTRKMPVDYSQGPAVAMIGGITKERGITQLVEAAHHAKAKLLLAGAFSPKTYETELKKSPAYACVDYKGFLDKKGMVALLEEANIGASTLLNVGQYDKIDTLPTKVYDYMSMQLPVVISNTDFAQKMNEKYHFAICIDPEKPEDIADAIKWLKEHPEQAVEMGNNGRKAIEEEFNWEKESEKLVDFYKNLLA
ncbi:MAG: glycosyltransferase [Bacteroidales bacterium]|nr:glycosyltransferase [Bacteroidales bacterium]MBR6227909.1 glycosyltransferase [Bacteroidales bacterium]